MTARTLPGDVARCTGIGSDADGWYDECETCLRRTAAPSDHPRQAHITPPAVIVFCCPSYMDEAK